MITKLLFTGTHRLIEWDEPNNPVSIVDRKNMKSSDGDSEPDVGEMCSVRCREQSKWVKYPGKLLAVGSKEEMELEMVWLDNLGSSDDEDEESTQATSEAAKSPPQSPPKGFVLAGNLSPGNISLGDGYLSDVGEPELSSSMPKQLGQSTPQLKDLTNKVMCVHTYIMAS